jgi:hypothetical protein
MAVSSIDRDTVSLLPGILRMEEDPDMTLYYLANWALEHRYKNTTKDGVRMWIKMQRKPLTELLTTFLPTILLLIITFATIFFKAEYFEAALSVNLTNMLVMTTIFMGVMQTLPTTSYVKMIDVWLIGCQLVPFIEVVLLTAKEFFREGDGSGETVARSLELKDKVTADGTKTINHHGSSLVVQLGQYGEEGGAPQAAPAPPDTLLDGEEEKTRKKHAKYIKGIKLVGECFLASLYTIDTFNTAFTETRVLPSLVVLASLVYSTTSAALYYELL